MGLKKIIVLGSTGSIGINALDIIKAYRDKFTVDALSCFSSVQALEKQMEQFSPAAVSVNKKYLPRAWDHPAVLYGHGEELLAMIRERDADLVLNGIAGASGLLPSLAALESGKNLALANKETIVMAGDLVRRTAEAHGCKILPVDSEHSALFQLLRNIPQEELEEIVLTASGGAVRDLPLEALEGITPEEALKHPNWSMGPKITIDSATMANKGLEIIEAWRLFSLPIEKVKVVIHPQSIVHSLVKTRDGAYYAQLGKPDMRQPILTALSWPGCLPNPYEDFDLTASELTFRPVDGEKYPLVGLAYKAAENPSGPIVYNASNEAAVAAFIQKQISFTQISLVVARALEEKWPGPAETLEEILAVDQKARAVSEKIIKTL